MFDALQISGTRSPSASRREAGRLPLIVEALEERDLPSTTTGLLVGSGQDNPTARANLAVTDVHLEGPVRIGPNDSLRFSFTIANTGGDPLAPDAGWIDRTILSRDGILGNDDDLVLRAYRRQLGLRPGADVEIHAVETLAGELHGPFHLFVETDSLRELPGETSDNARELSALVQVEGKPPNPSANQNTVPGATDRGESPPSNSETVPVGPHNDLPDRESSNTTEHEPPSSRLSFDSSEPLPPLLPTVFGVRGETFVAVANQTFLGVVATFQSSFHAPSPEPYFSTIDWGDGHVSFGKAFQTGSTVSILASNKFDVEGTFRVSVSIGQRDVEVARATGFGEVLPPEAGSSVVGALGRGERETNVRVSSGNLFDEALPAHLRTNRPLEADVSLERGDTTALDSDAPATVILAPVAATGRASVADPLGGIPGQPIRLAIGEADAGTTSPAVAPIAVSTFEIRTRNLIASDRLVVSLQYPNLDDVSTLPLVAYKTAQGWRRIVGAQGLREHLVREMGAEELARKLASGEAVLDERRGLYFDRKNNRVIFLLDGDSSTPRANGLTGTVFTIALPQTQLTPPPVESTPALALASPALVSSLAQRAEFTSTSRLSLSLTASNDSSLSASRTVVGSAALAAVAPASTPHVGEAGENLDEVDAPAEWAEVAQDRDLFWLWFAGEAPAQRGDAERAEAPPEILIPPPPPPPVVPAPTDGATDSPKPVQALTVVEAAAPAVPLPVATGPAVAPAAPVAQKNNLTAEATALAVLTGLLAVARWKSKSPKPEAAEELKQAA